MPSHHHRLSQSLLNQPAVEMKTVVHDFVFFGEDGVVVDVGDVAAVDVGLVCFDHNEGAVFEGVFDEGFGAGSGVDAGRGFTARV